jgi:hypothetical protein
MLPLLHDFPDPGKSHRNPCSSPPSDTLKGSAASFVIRLRRVHDDALAEQVEAGAAVHLALDHLKS